MPGHPSDQLTAYADGTLAPEDAAEIAAHLAECAHCHDVLDDLLAVRTLLRALPEHAPHPALLPRTLARLDARRSERFLLPRWAVALAIGVASVALALQLRILPTQQDPYGGAWYFQTHAQLAATHPMADVTLTSYLSSVLPYEPFQVTPEPPGTP